MKTSTIFKKAKKYLSTGNHDYGQAYYICTAIEVAIFRYEKNGEVTNHSFDAVNRAQGIIHTRLGMRYNSLESWLKYEHGVVYSPLFSDKQYDDYVTKLQATRHAWLDSLIAEFKAKGD